MFLTPFFFGLSLEGRKLDERTMVQTGMGTFGWMFLDVATTSGALFGCWEKDGSFEQQGFLGKRFLGPGSYEICFGEDVDVMFFQRNSCLSGFMVDPDKYQWAVCVCFIVEP